MVFVGGYEKKGELIKIEGFLIYVQCLRIASNPKEQDRTCVNCCWHRDPRRDEGYILQCKMY